MLSFIISLYSISSFFVITDSISINYRLNFTRKLDSLQNSKNLEAGLIGVSIRNCKTNETVIDFNGKKALRPASTLKLITTATAFAILGENFRYETNLDYSGTIRNDTLFGNLIIKGSGDPTLGSWRFDKTLNYSRLFYDWATKIQKLNVKVITGNVLANSSIFTDNSMPETWQWGDIGNYYGASSFGININENLFKAHFKTGKTSSQNSNLFQIEPNLPDYDIINEVVGDSNTNNDDVLFFSSPLGNVISAKGKLPLNCENFVVKGSIPNPPDLTTHLLKNMLGKLNISVLNQKKISKNYNLINIAKVKSPSLFEICQQTNYESINLYAESLIKTIGTINQKSGNSENGVETLKKYWQSKSLNLSDLYMKDGSGLSTVDAISPNTMTSILAVVSNESYFTAFHQGIPVLGLDGTVKNISKNKSFAKNFSVKSGTIEKVKSFAGYYKNKNGELMSFSIIANQFNGSGGAMGRELSKLFEDMYELE